MSLRSRTKPSPAEVPEEWDLEADRDYLERVMELSDDDRRDAILAELEIEDPDRASPNAEEVTAISSPEPSEPAAAVVGHFECALPWLTKKRRKRKHGAAAPDTEPCRGCEWLRHCFGDGLECVPVDAVLYDESGVPCVPISV